MSRFQTKPKIYIYPHIVVPSPLFVISCVGGGFVGHSLRYIDTNWWYVWCGIASLCLGRGRCCFLYFLISVR